MDVFVLGGFFGGDAWTKFGRGVFFFFEFGELFVDFERVDFEVQVRVFDEVVYAVAEDVFEVELAGTATGVGCHHP